LRHFYCKCCGYVQAGADCDDMACDRCGANDWSPVKTPPMTDCEDCLGHGWLLVQVDSRKDDQRIERCDNCDRFKTDSEANEFVSKLAWAAERPAVEEETR
jgi:hypothetical protein